MSSYALLKQNAICFVDPNDAVNPDKVGITCSADNVLNLVGNGDANNEPVLIKNIADPIDDRDVVHKKFVADLLNGLMWKAPVRAAATTKPADAAGAVVDDVTLNAGDRIIVISDPADVNAGIWEYDGSVFSRPSDFSTHDPATDLLASHASAASVWVQEGTNYSDRSYVCTTDSPADKVDTDPLAFVQFASGNGDSIIKNPSETQTINTHPLIIASTNGISGNGDPPALQVNGSITAQDDCVFSSRVTIGDDTQVAGITTITNTTSSTTPATGALVVDGGVGVAENVNVGQNISVGGTATVTGIATLSDATDLDADTDNGTHSLKVEGGTRLMKSVHIMATKSCTDTMPALQVDGGAKTVELCTDSLELTATDDATFTDAAAAALGLQGGLHVTKRVRIENTEACDGTEDVGSIATKGGVYVGQNVCVKSTTDSTDGTDGALVVDGGIGVSGKTVFTNTDNGGNANAVATQPVRFLGSVGIDQDLIMNTGTGLIRSGQIFLGNNGNPTSSGATNAALRLTSGGATIAGNVYFNSATTSTSATTGGFVTAGGVGIGENLHIASAGVCTVHNTANTTDGSDGALVVAGGVGIGADLCCVGNGKFNQVTATSDERLKKNVEELTPSEKFDHIKPVSYDWKKDDTKSNGVIAQQLKDLYPEMVKSDQNGMLSVDYNQLIGILIAEVQDLKKKVNQ